MVHRHHTPGVYPLMKNLLRAAAISVASTALVAGGATVATAAPSAPVSTSSAVTASSNVSIAGFPMDPQSKIRVNKRGSKLKFRLTARFLNEFGRPVGVRKATIQVHKKGKWRTLKNVRLNSEGRGSYKRTDGKKRKYRMLIKPTSLYVGGVTKSLKI
jgi:hypothetical protein